MSRPFRIAVVGDVHLRWDARDATALEREAYDLVLFVGDLAQHRPRAAIEVARAISALRIPSVLIPGNHDVGVPLQRAALRMGLARVASSLASRQRRSVEELRLALGAAELGGYSLHRLERPGSSPIQILAARPHSIGGRKIGYPAYLRAAFGVQSLNDSAERLRSLLDGAEEGPLIVLAHSGPSGLGGGRGAIWGRGRERDFGDPDLRAFIEYARSLGRAPVAVVAGHLHHRPRRGPLVRPTLVEEEGTLFVNAAEVPRHRRSGEGVEAYHVAIAIDGMEVEVEERWLRIG